MQIFCALSPTPHNSTTVVGKMVRHSTKVLTARYEVILSKVSKSVIMEQRGASSLYTPTLDYPT